MHLLVVLLLAGLVLLTINLQRTYHDVPEKELRRRARRNDPTAEALYRAAAYGASLRGILWFLVIGSSAIFFVYVARISEVWAGLIISAALVWFGFIWLPTQEATKASVWIAARIAPPLTWILQYAHAPLGYLQRITQRRPSQFHTGLYDKEDLLSLIEHQANQPHNLIPEAELDIAIHALSFADKTVGEVLTPRRTVRMVGAEDTLGPVLMDELHGSGFSRFPVYEGKKDNIVGILYLRDLVRAKDGGKVNKVMHRTVCYLHEDQKLDTALAAILKTHQHLYIVVNSFEEYVGVVSMEDILEEIIGKQIQDEFDQHEDMRAVAARAAHDDHREHTQKPSSEPTEVVELSE